MRLAEGVGKQLELVVGVGKGGKHAAYEMNALPVVEAVELEGPEDRSHDCQYVHTELEVFVWSNGRR